LVERLLGRSPQITLLAAQSGAEGIALARTRRPDVVLLDLHLPDMDGEDVIRQLRADPRTATLSIVTVSADGSEARTHRLRAMGCTNHLVKPFDLPRLLHVVGISGTPGERPALQAPRPPVNDTVLDRETLGMLHAVAGAGADGCAEVRSLIATFTTDAEARLRALRTALEAGDPAAAGAVAHALAGSCASFAAADAASVCRRIHAAAVAGQRDLWPEVRAFEVAFARARLALEAEFAVGPDVDAAAR
jgi:CheY-like chemotaxis protein